MRRVAVSLFSAAPRPIMVAALGATLFGLWMHPSVLDVGNHGWLLAGDDRGQGALGTAAYLRDPDPWPSLRGRLLAAPDGLTLLFTDSIPLIGVALRPFAGLLPGGLQFVGLWYLLCALLQAAFAWALVRRRVADPVAALLGATLLAAMPAFFSRYPHASLCAQWLILWALWIFLDPRRSRSTWWWPAVLAAAALVHSYLLLMVAAIWASAMLAALVRGGERRRTLAQAALSLGVVAVILAGLGAFAGPFSSSRLYGNWPVALDAWWNPQNPGYAALLPSSGDPAGTGFEGLQYLGAGLLAVLVGAIAVAVRGRVRWRERAMVRRLFWLGPAVLVLLPIAVGPAPMWRGAPLFSIHLPLALVDALDPVRAASRLMWPVTYVAAFAAIVIVARTRRATLFLAAALSLQIVDLAPMMKSIRAASARADDPTVFTRTRDARWSSYVARAGAIDFQPPDLYGDLALMQEVSWRAVEACRPVLFTYAARQTRAAATRLAAGAAAVKAGDVPDDRMIVFLHGAPPAALASRIVRLDGVAVLPPRRSAPDHGRCSG